MKIKVQGSSTAVLESKQHNVQHKETPAVFIVFALCVTLLGAVSVSTEANLLLPDSACTKSSVLLNYLSHCWKLDKKCGVFACESGPIRAAL